MVLFTITTIQYGLRQWQGEQKGPAAAVADTGTLITHNYVMFKELIPSFFYLEQNITFKI